ncbi:MULTISPECIES: hypothetical protein [Thioclava]|uniref:Uncharacterized protein n=1 Tax=Thioclava kandeliae TaxID=3070818 RepID=A0ABV1SCW1_9RHOB
MRLEVAILFFSMLVAPLAHLSGSVPERVGLVVMIVPPWSDASVVAEDAGAQLIGPTRAPFGQLVSIDNMAQAEQLEKAGAWFLLDAEKVEWICG